MKMWGVRTYTEDLNKPETENGFLVLKKDHLKAYTTKLSSMPPHKSNKENIEYAINNGIPVEFFIDTGILVQELDKFNIEDLNISSEDKNRMIKYYKYVYEDSRKIVGKDKAEDKSAKVEERLNTKINKYVALVCEKDGGKDEEELLKGKFTEIFRITEYDEYIDLIEKEDDIINNMTFLVAKDISDKLAKETEIFQIALEDNNFEMDFVDLSGKTRKSEKVVQVTELTEEIVNYIINGEIYKIKSTEKDIDDNEDVVEGEKYKEDYKENGDITEEKTEEGEVKTGEEKTEEGEDTEIEDVEIRDTETGETGDTETVDTEEEKINRDNIEEMAEIQDDLIKHTRISISKSEAGELSRVVEVEQELEIKNKIIETLEENNKIITKQNKVMNDSNKELGKKIKDYSEEYTKLNNELNRIKQIENSYNKMKPEYEELKEFKNNSDKEIKEFKKEHDKQLNNYKEMAEIAEKSAKELKEQFEIFYESTSNLVETKLSMLTDKKTLYFKIIEQPNYFRSMINYISEILGGQKKVCILALKDFNEINKRELGDWIELKEEITEEQVINSDYKIFSKYFGKKEIERFSEIIADVDMIIVLDFYASSFNFIVGDKVNTIHVLRWFKQKSDYELNDGGNIICGDENSLVDLSFDDKYKNYTIKLLKNKTYEKRLGEFFDKFGLR